MATDFSYNGKTINSSGPIKPSGKDMPGDPRTRVNTFADIENIPNPYIGMPITVKADETNSNKMTDYIVLSLKANASGMANSVVDQVQRYVDYLGASSGGSVSQEDINTAVNNYLTEHPVQSGATAEQAAQIEANRTAIGDKSELPTGDANIIDSINRIDNKGGGLTSEQAQQLADAYSHSQTTHVSADDIPTTTSQLTNDSNFVTKSYVDSITVIPEGSLTMIDVIDGEVFSVLNNSSEVYGGIVLSTSSLSFNENSSSSFTVKLSQAPTNNQTVNIKVNNSYCTIDKSSLTFTSSDYSIAQTVTVTGVADSSSYSNKSSVITLSSTGVSSKTVNVTLVNTDVEPTISSISAVYTQGDTVVYPTTSLDSLKSNLVVTANYTNSTSTTVTGYTLSGTLTEGTSTITVTYSGKTTTFTVNVSGVQTTAVTGVTINETASIEVDKSISLIASISPSDATDKTVTWSVDNANCTITPNGLSCTIKGVTEGSSIVTVTTTDGNYTDSCTVTITAKQEVSIPTENLIRNYDFTTYTDGTVEDQAGGLNITPTGTVVNGGLYIDSNLNVTNMWDKNVSSTVFITASASKNSNFFYLGDNILNVNGTTLKLAKGSQTVGTTTDINSIYNTYNVYALSIDVSTKHQKLYFNGELILEGDYTSDWSENAMILYNSITFNKLLFYNTVLNADDVATISDAIAYKEEVSGITVSNIAKYFDFTAADASGSVDIVEPYGIGVLKLSGTYSKMENGIQLASGANLTDTGYFGISTIASPFTVGIRMSLASSGTAAIFQILQNTTIEQNGLNINVKNSKTTTSNYSATLGTFFNVFITYDVDKTLSFYVDGNLIGTIANAVTSKAQPYLFNSNVVYNKLIVVNSCLSADEITMLNNEVK